MTIEGWKQYMENKRRIFGAKFTEPKNPELIRYLHTEQRVEIEDRGQKLRGFIGITTGWVPAFLLLRTKRSTGSSYILSDETRVLRELRY